MAGTVTSEPDFYAVDVLRLLSDYLCQMTVCRNTPGELVRLELVNMGSFREQQCARHVANIR